MIDDTQLDMLVDGELSEAQRREVLATLDMEPDGWRRCALAFLESQGWREEMRAISGESVETASSASKPRPAWPRLRTVLAMAASFLLALGLGLGFDNLIGRNHPQVPPLHPTNQVAELSQPKESIDAESAADPALDALAESAVPYRYVTLPAQDPVSGEAESIRMPVVPQEYLGEGWPYQLPSVLPDRVVQRLRQRGHDVVQERHLVPFQAADGSRVVFPVDQVELVPVASRGYQ